MYARGPEPAGYDSAGIWSTAENPEFGALMLRPWHVEFEGWTGGAARMAV